MKSYNSDDFFTLAEEYQQEKFKFIDKLFERTYKRELKDKKWYESKRTIRDRAYRRLEQTWIELELQKLRLVIQTM